MEKNLVSVVMPTYMREPKLIKRAINSVLNQTYRSIELIVVDDSPNDYHSRPLVKEYIESFEDNRIVYIAHAKNMGANKARNTGIKLSIGEYIAFLDDDDEWLPQKIELQIKEMKSDNEIALVNCKAILFNEVTNTKRYLINEINYGYYYKELLRQNFIGSNSFVLVKKEVIDEVGLYDENLLSNQDYDLFLRIAKKHKISGVNKVLVNYYVHDGERISTNNLKQLQGRLAIFDKYYNDISNDHNLKLGWKIKNIPLYFNAGYKLKSIQLLIELLLKNPIGFIGYLKGTVDYRKKVHNSTVNES
ncbi:glycosyltransferase family 2 protein [Ruoffia tabacinasalis]|uniref:Glycosyltransferase n=1 Tax=Ruoffia tabacinasalis TaxID=87458 RepID=A0ABS0LM93_9LACT|nr:glycosyltransferase [Ruoffia tabacinasalis]MBG9978581.1 glycosyltransferase [Ruoffia tabacinasalis]